MVKLWQRYGKPFKFDRGKPLSFVTYTAHFQEKVYHTFATQKFYHETLQQVYHRFTTEKLPQRLPQLLPRSWGGKMRIFWTRFTTRFAARFTTEWRLIFRAFLRKNAKALIPIWAALWIPWSSRRVLISPHWCVHVCARVSREGCANSYMRE